MSSKKKETTFTKEELKEGDLNFHYWKSLGNLIALIKSSELKAGLILSFFGIIFSFVYQNVERVKVSLAEFNILYALLLFWLISTLISIYHSVNTFIPRIEKKYDANLFFFEDIITKFGDVHEFSNTLLKETMDKSKIYEQLGQQIFINAKITSVKFKNVNLSIRYMVISLLFLLLIILSEIGILLFYR